MATSWTDITTGGATTSSDNAWTTWVDSTSTSSETVWGNWVSAGTSSGSTITYQDGNYFAPSPSPETEEQRQTREERDRQNQEELEAARLKKEEARKKAEELLRENLDKEQREQFDKTEWFFVISQSGKQYRIRPSRIGNVDEIKDDMVKATYCIHPSMHVPLADSMLVQKLMLELDEDRFVKIANKTTLSTPRPLAV